MDDILTNEPMLRLSAFVGILILVALWEAAAPKRKRAHTRIKRWPSNFLLVALNTAALRLFIPWTAIEVAFLAQNQGWGVLNQIELPSILSIIITIVALDLVIYFQHRLFHAVPILWRLHRMHHADLDIDVTTGARFHPVEILLSMLIKLAAVYLLGASAIGVLLFEIILNGMAMFNHGNIRVPQKIDQLLRLVVVTPDMHRVHHSVDPSETHQNFGFNIPWWDRLFGTYTAQPKLGHGEMTIGLPYFRDVKHLRVDRLLLQPFFKSTRDKD